MEMLKSQELFFELLYVSTGANNTLRQQYTDEQWNGALAIAQNQAIAGVLLGAVELLPKEQFPSKPTLLKWIGNAEVIEMFSAKMFKLSAEVINFFRERGFACQILKGSAVAQYYPDPYKRSSGDIDVWVDGSREIIYNFARGFEKDGILQGVNYHHIHFHLIDDVPIEVHIWPSFLSSPLRNSRLHRFCDLHRPTMDTDKPTLEFDRVFILLHCYRHMCGHGLGLRQIMDYYYVLQQGFTEEEKKESAYWIKALGMNRFAGGIMWVLQKYFGLKEQFLLMSPNEKEGRFIIQEVMQTGNMGHSDTRNWGSIETPFSRFIYNLKRDCYLAKHYPHESLWQPLFSLWVYCWRLRNGLLKNIK